MPYITQTFPDEKDELYDLEKRENVQIIGMR